MPEIISDEQLVKDYLKGDDESLEILIKRYLQPVYGFVRRLVRDQAAAEDVTQDVFARMWQNLNQFKQDKSFKPWLYGIARNAALDWLKKKKALPLSAFEDEAGNNFLAETLADTEPLADEILARQDAGELLESALSRLPLSYQTVLLLYYTEQLNFQEIAELLKEPIDTVKSRQRRALFALKKLLEEK